jgi:hypothetical protein
MLGHDTGGMLNGIERATACGPLAVVFAIVMDAWEVRWSSPQ